MGHNTNLKSVLRPPKSLAPSTAGEFPLLAEGNLGREGKAGKAVKPAENAPTFCWRTKTGDIGRKHIELSCKDTAALADPPSFGLTTGAGWLTAYAVDENGHDQEGVSIDFALSTESGLLATWRWLTNSRDRRGRPCARVELANDDLKNTPTGAKKFIITASQTPSQGQEYAQASLELPIADGRWEKRLEVKGFDEKAWPPWVVVGATRTSQAAQLRMSNASGQGYAISVQNVALAQIIPNITYSGVTLADVTGTRGGETEAYINQGASKIARLAISVKVAKGRTVKFFGIKDSTGRDGTLTQAEAQQMLALGKTLWRDQAVIDLTQATGETLLINKDLGAKPSYQDILDNVLSQVEEPPAGETHVLVMWDYDLSDRGARLAFASTGLIVINKAAAQQTLAHEIGHTLGCPHHYEAGNLMDGPGVHGGEVLRKFQADIVHTEGN